MNVPHPAALALADTEPPRDWPTNAATAWDHECAKLRAAVEAGDGPGIRSASAQLNRIRDVWGDQPGTNGSKPPEPLLLTWAEYVRLAEARPDGEFVVPRLYRRGQSSILVGEPKAGKSTLCRRLAVQVAMGGDVLGYAVPAAVAVYMPLGEDPRHVVREIEKISPEPGVKLLLHNPGQPMEWDRLAAELLAIDAALLIVDMVSDFRPWSDGNDYDEMKEAISKFTTLARDTNAHVLLVHHGKKAPPASYPVARVLGSQAIAGEVDVVASVHRDPKQGRIFQAEGRGIAAFERPL